MEITKQEVAALIEKEAEDSLRHHLLNVFSFDHMARGEIKERQIKIWKKNPFIRASYPIHTFKFNDKGHLIDIQSRKNPVVKWLNVIFLALIAIPFISLVMEPFLFDRILLFVFIFGLIVLLLHLITRSIYKFELKEQLKKIYDALDMEMVEEPVAKEWSWKMILTRLFIYPFCIGLILLSIYELIPQGKIKMAFFAIGISIVVLGSDILILIRKAKSKNKST